MLCICGHKEEDHFKGGDCLEFIQVAINLYEFCPCTKYTENVN